MVVFAPDAPELRRVAQDEETLEQRRPAPVAGALAAEAQALEADPSADLLAFRVDLTGEADDAVVLAEDFSAAPAGDLGVGYAPSATGAAAIEFPYSVPNVVALFFVAVLLAFAGVMMLDMVWSIWSWQEPYSMSSSLLDALLGIFGMN